VSSLDERRIAEIVQRVMADLHPQGPPPRPDTAVTAAAPATGHEGVYPDVDAAVAAARVAQERLAELPLERRAALIAAMRQGAMESAHALAHAAWQETGMGRAEDKVEKNLLVAERTPGTEVLQAQAWTGDRGLSLVEMAPYGVIGAITPSTNPTSTIISNAIGMIAAGNSAVFNAHPGAKSVLGRDGAGPQPRHQGCRRPARPD
jgi:acyl-CoA reductase-like NAD-dependent aldehyde dehydrogenase